MKKDNSRSMKEFLKGVGIIAATVLTGILPGAILMSMVYCTTGRSLFDFFKPHQKGNKFATEIYKNPKINE